MLGEEAENVLANGGVAWTCRGVEVGLIGGSVRSIGEPVGETCWKSGDRDVSLLVGSQVIGADDWFGGVKEGSDAGGVEGYVLGSCIDDDELKYDYTVSKSVLSVEDRGKNSHLRVGSVKLVHLVLEIQSLNSAQKLTFHSGCSCWLNRFATPEGAEETAFLWLYNARGAGLCFILRHVI